jgi:hypothetical protein
MLPMDGALQEVSMRSLVSATAALIAVTAAAPRAQAETPVLKVGGYALNLTGVGSGRSGNLEITIDRWSSPEDGDRLQRAMAEGGIPGLTRTLPTLSAVGHVGTARGGNLALRFARELPATSGRRIVLATDRVGAPADGSHPSADTHDFLVVEILLDANGKGQLRTAAPQRLYFDAKAKGITLASQGVDPVWVQELRVLTTP